MTLRAAAVQFFATPFALERNLHTAEHLIRQAVEQGAQVVVLPAFFNTGYVYAPRLRAVPKAESDTTRQWLLDVAHELNIVVGGACLERDGQTLYNTFLLAEPNGLLQRVQQHHPFIWERFFFRSGSGPAIVQTSLGRIGLLVGWDAAYRASWAKLQSADLILVSSAPPRFHRAVLNFPEAKKVYVADLLPEVLATRDVLDDWFLGNIGQGAALANAPVASATLSGRFVTQLPFPRLSFGMLALGRSRYLSWTLKAHQATLRATFAGTSATFDSQGKQLVLAMGEESVACSPVESATPSGQVVPQSPSPYLFPHIPRAFLRLDSLLSLFVKPFSNPIS